MIIFTILTLFFLDFEKNNANSERVFSKIGFEIIAIGGEAFSKPNMKIWNQMHNSTIEITFEKTVATQLKKI